MEAWARCNLSASAFRWPGLFVISGHRSEALQAQLNSPAENSLHTLRPSLAADLRVGDLPASTTPWEIWAALGNWWKHHVNGGRWGGDFSTPDPNHFDTGLLRVACEPTIYGGMVIPRCQLPS